MTVLLEVLLAAASLSLGFRATAFFVEKSVHPMDRLAVAAIAGGLITAVILQVSASYRVFELGLGLVLSLSPVGPFDLTKWWFRSRGRRSGWLVGANRSAVVLTLRYLAIAAVVVAGVLTYQAIAGMRLLARDF